MQCLIRIAQKMLHCVWWFVVQDPHNIVMNELRFGPRLGIKSEINSDFDILCQAGMY